MEREHFDLLVSWGTITLAFSLVLSENFLNLYSFFEALPIAALGVGSGFILHELAHKYVAIRYGAHAEFRMWSTGLILAIILPIVTGLIGRPFLFAAPGAVYIFDHVSRKQNGLISLAGPATNVVLGVLFIFLGLLFDGAFFSRLFLSAASINFFLGFFNMIPIFPLDGSKVLAWNGLVWAIVFFPLAFLVFFYRILT